MSEKSGIRKEISVTTGGGGDIGLIVVAAVIALALLSFHKDIRCALGNQPACDAAATSFMGKQR